MTTLPIPRTITPLVRRHAEDAAFYWGLLDGSVNSPRLTLQDLSRFGDMLDAHLDGLHIAAQDGWAPCLAALERWRKPADAFVCAHQAFSLGDAGAIEALLVQLRARPDELLRGMISALAWLPQAQTATIVRQWTAPDSELVKQVAALRAAALIGADAASLLGQPIEHFLDSGNAHVRAAACRAAATMPQQAALSACLGDPDMTVRAEAAIALGSAAETLQQCILAQVAVLNGATGWYRHQAARRLRRWVRYLATMIAPGQPDIPALLDAMPPRISLHFIAWHGDPAHLPYAIAKMAQPDLSRYAGWAWQTITGVDLESNGLILPDPAPSADSAGISEARLDADDGLPLPDGDAIARYATAGLPAGARCLSGKILTPRTALDALETAPQAHRSMAGHFLRPHYAHLRLAPRGPLAAQREAIAQLRRLLAEEDAR